jgi:hypothetical protein
LLSRDVRKISPILKADGFRSRAVSRDAEAEAKDVDADADDDVDAETKTECYCREV